MSMYTTLQNNPKVDSHSMMHSLDGNLCRCTGYRPILDAAKSVNTIEIRLILIRSYVQMEKIAFLL
jgi:xanthine dehydrogenase iron-sulfur cluster and FAD-binding subunit A